MQLSFFFFFDRISGKKEGPLRGRSQLSTFMKVYTAYARRRGSGTTVRFSPENQHLFLITDNVLFKIMHIECGQYAHICRSFMYNNTFEALFLSLDANSGAKLRFL